MARLTMWQLCLGEALFEGDIGDGQASLHESLTAEDNVDEI
jgi:hypothetical protein